MPILGRMNPVGFGDDVTGAVHRLAVDPSNPATVYAGSVNGGVWKTTDADSIFGSDAGAPARPHWETNTDRLPSLTIGAMAMDRSNSQHLVAGTGARSNGLPPGVEGRVYETYDGGNTWASVGDQSLLGDKQIRGIVVRGDLILVATGSAWLNNNHGSVFLSTARNPAGARTWNSLADPAGGPSKLPATFGTAFDVVADPSSAGRYYVIVGDKGYGGSGLYMTSDSAQTWTRVSDNDASPTGLAKALQAWGPNFKGDYEGANSARLAIGPTGVLSVAVATLGQPVYVGYTLDQGQHWTEMDVPSRPARSDQAPTTARSIASITRVGVPAGGVPAGGVPDGGVPDGGVPDGGVPDPTIIVNTGSPHELKSDDLEHRNLRVRILGVPGLPDGDWIAGPYYEFPTNNPPPDGGGEDGGGLDSGNPDGGKQVSPNKFTLLSRYTRANGDGSTTPLDVTGQGTWQFWRGTNPGSQGDTNLAIAVDPTDAKFVYLGGDADDLHLVRGDSSVGPSTAIPSPQWTTLVNEGSHDKIDVHADIRDFAFDASGALLYVCSDGGVFVRTSPQDSTGRWYSIAGDLMSAELRSIALDPLSHAILGGTQDNGTPTQMQPSSGTPVPWTEIETADGVAVAALDAHTTYAGDPNDPNDPNIGKPISYRYTSFQGSTDFRLHIFDDAGALLKTVKLCDPNDLKLIVTREVTDAGTVLTTLNQVDNFDWLPAIGVNRQPGAEKWLLIPGNKQGVWESRDLGDNVTLVPGSPTNAKAFSWGNGTNREGLWVATESTVYSRFAAGALALEANFPTGCAWPCGVGIAMSATDPNVAYATLDSHVYKISHGNTAFQDVTGDLSYLRYSTNGSTANEPNTGPGKLRSIVYVPSAAKGDLVIVAAADAGVPGVFMMAVDNPGVWTRLGTNLPNVNAEALDYDPATDMLVVGTGGRGAWSLTGVTSLNRAPKAICKDVTVSADATCHGTTSPSAFNNGWLDPDGNPLTATAVDPNTLETVSIGPYSLGGHSVTIDLADNQGASALCKNQQLTVVDTTPPVLQIPADKSVRTCADTVVVSIGQATATDNCSTSLLPTGTVIAKNGANLSVPIPVTNGQVTLSPGTYTVQWSVSDGSTAPVQANQTVTVGATIEVSQTFLLDDRAQLRSAAGGYAAVLNSGTGTTRVGQDCRVGGIVSRAPVTVQHRAVVSGNVVSGSTVTKDSDATVTGTITQNASVQLPALPTLPSFPTPTMGGFIVNAGTTVTKSPGSYSSATTINGGTLILRAGDYYFQSLTINSGAILRVTATTRVFVRDALIFNSPFLASSGGAVQPIFLGFAGRSLSLYAVFKGTLVAPNASVIFGTGSGLTFTGSFFGRQFEVTPGSALVCSI